MNPQNPFHSYTLPNGLFISIYDWTKPYFGDFYRVKIEIICSKDAQTSTHRPTALYSRTLEKMGVASNDVENVKQKLVDDFNANSLPYLSLKEFPQKMTDQSNRKKQQINKKYIASGC